ncbi:50S ribosomal protein L29 [Patescibacteria group bacterium]|nr:50S ribosomal protein L29 [Patescibacteria group bacterium]
MEYKELKKKSVKDLQKFLAENREKLRDLRFKVSQKQVKNIREIRVVKKTIAQILMLLNAEQKQSKFSTPQLDFRLGSRTTGQASTGSKEVKKL